MPNYPALAAQGIYTDSATGIRVFAGQRAETFYIDLGAVFDTLNLRRRLPTHSGANISTIAIEVPIKRVTSDGKPASTTKHPVIGIYAETDRQKVRVLGEQGVESGGQGPFVQVSRMANPLVNELIITTPFKDRWNASEPEDEANFQAFYKKPVVATELNLVFGVPIAPIDKSDPSNRTDLMSILLKYPGQKLNGTNCGQPCAELLRLDLRDRQPLRARISESAIAMSVVLAALNNLVAIIQAKRWVVAFCFGLIHGFGFAGVLTDLGLPRNVLALALVGFNLGVEAGQIAIVSVFLPLAYLLRRTWLYRNIVLAGGSSAIVVVAALWFVERAFDLNFLPIH
jgi:hypothetical protein